RELGEDTKMDESHHPSNMAGQAIFTYRPTTHLAPDDTHSQSVEWLEATISDEGFNNLIEGRRSELALIPRHLQERTIFCELSTIILQHYFRFGTESSLNDAIDLERRALKYISTGFQRAKCLLALGNLLCLRSRRKKAVRDMEYSIRAAKEHIYPLPSQAAPYDQGIPCVDHTDEGIGQTIMCSTLVDVDEGIDVSHEAFELIPDDFLPRAQWLRTFASMLLHRYSLSTTLKDVDQAIELCRIATQDDSLGPTGTLIEALLTRVAANLDEYDILEVIDLCEECLSMSPQDRKRTLQYLAEAFHFFYLLTGSTEYRDRSIDTCGRAIDVARGSLQSLVVRCHRLRSRLLYIRYQQSGNLNDLDDSMASAATVAKILFTPAPKSKATLFSILVGNWVMETEAMVDQAHFTEAIEWPACIRIFGTSRIDALHEICLRQYERYEVKGRTGDLQDVVDMLRQMVELVPSRALRSSLGNRALQLYSEFEFLKTLLVEARTIFRQLVEESKQDQNHRQYLMQLAYSLCRQHERTGDNIDLFEAIDIGTAIFETTKHNDAAYPLMLNSFGEIIYQQCRVSKTLPNIDHMLFLLQTAIDSTMSHAPTKPLSKKVECLFWKYRMTDDATLLDSAVELARRAARSLPNKYPNHHCIIRHRLAMALHEQYLRKPTLPCLKEAIDLERQNLQPGQFTRYVSHANLTSLLSELHVATGRREHLEEAFEMERMTRYADSRNIRCFRGAHEYIPGILDSQDATDLANKFYEHLGASSDTGQPRARDLSSLAFMLMGGDENETAIRYAREGLELAPAKSSDLPWQLCCLVLCLEASFVTSNNAFELVEMIELAKRATELSPHDHPGRPFYLSVLSIALHSRFMKTGRSSDLNQAIKHGVDAYNLTYGDTTQDDSNRYLAASHLSLFLQHKYLREGVPSDFNQSKELHQEARNCRQRLTKDKVYFRELQRSPDRPYSAHLGTNTTGSFELLNKRPVYALLPDKLDCHPRLFNVGKQYLQYYEETGDEYYLANALDALTSSLASILDTHIAYPSRIHLIGRCYEEYYKRSIACDSSEEDKKDRLKDLNMAISKFRDLVSILSSNDVLRTDILRRLGHLCSDQLFYNFGIEDLKIAVEVHQECLGLSPESGKERAIWLRHLGCSKLTAYGVFKDVSDLHKSIDLLEQAKDENPHEPVFTQEVISGLSAAYIHRFMVTKDIRDIDAAIGMYQDSALNRTLGVPMLGRAYLIRYERTKAPEDIKLAISTLKEALKLAQKHMEASEVTGVLKSLTNCYLTKHHYGGTLHDIEQAIRYAQDAVDVIPKEAFQVLDISGLLGLCYKTKFDVTKCEDDLLMAIDADEKDFWDFMSIAKASDSLLLAQRLMEAYKILQNWKSGCKIAQYALELIPAYTPRYLQWSDAQALLSRISGLASFGAAFSVQSGKPDGRSLTMLERGRGVIANLLYDLRLDFDSRKFADLKPEFKQKLLGSIGQLENLTPRVNQLPGLASDEPISGLVELTKRLEASKMVNEFMEGLNARLKPDSIGFSPLTKNGPIVIINVSFRCDAFILKHMVETMPLPKLTQEEIEQRLRDGDLGSTKTLEWLWNAVAGPILDYLGYTEIPPNNEWPQICWITTGALSRFPLHAAGYHTDGSRRTVIDRAMSSYSSSLTAILETPVKARQDSSTKAVLVAMQNTPGTTSALPYAPKELSIVRDVCNSMQLNSVEPTRRTQQVLAQLKDCKIFHFAGHGETDDTNPLKSQLRLEDWQTQPLTVSDLLNLNLRDNPPFLAYLSACGTSQIKDKRLLDESLHLISACQLAGFRHVVGTLWEVGDEACVDVAETVYKELRDSSMDDHSVCRGLHKATRKLRDSWLVEVHMRTVRRGHDTSIGEDQNGSVDRSARDIIPMDDYENQRPAPWVAYVYFGSRW
ncbi:hypothetical protein ACHAQI_006733, partial [Fusarium lateritium]